MAAPDGTYSTMCAAAALDYAARGWAVFPLVPGGKVPATPHGFKDATTDEAQIRRWWGSRQQAGVAVATGPPSGLFVLDVDIKTVDGRETLRDLEERHARLPEGPQALTPSGGCHYYFAMPPAVHIGGSVGLLGPGLDIRAVGGYAVLPPTRLADGSEYVWEASSHPDVPLPSPPAWLLTFLAERKAPNGTGGNPPGGAWRLRQKTIPPGHRNDSLVRVAGWLHLYHPQPVVEALLAAINDARCTPPLPRDDIVRIAASVGRYPVPGTPGHPRAVVPSFRREVGNAL